MIVRLSIAATLCAAPVTAVTLDTDAASPIAGETTTLRFRADDGAAATGIAVAAHYRQNAHQAIAHDEELGVTGADGTLSWTPLEAGVVVLSWDGGSQNVSVVHGRTPLSGLFVTILAGLMLLGGTTLFFLRMMREDELPKDAQRFDT